MAGEGLAWDVGGAVAEGVGVDCCAALVCGWELVGDEGADAAAGEVDGLAYIATTTVSGPLLLKFELFANPNPTSLKALSSKFSLWGGLFIHPVTVSSLVANP